MTLSDFRADLVHATSIPVGQQRLIFFGRVLTPEYDAKTLNELGIADKVVHLVARSPHSSTAAHGRNDAPPAAAEQHGPTPINVADLQVKCP